MDTRDRLSEFFATLPSVRVMASFPDITSKRTTPNAYTSLLLVARPSLRYLQDECKLKEMMKTEPDNYRVHSHTHTPEPGNQKFQQLLLLILHHHWFFQQVLPTQNLISVFRNLEKTKNG